MLAHSCKKLVIILIQGAPKVTAVRQALENIIFSGVYLNRTVVVIVKIDYGLLIVVMKP